MNPESRHGHGGRDTAPATGRKTPTRQSVPPPVGEELLELFRRTVLGLVRADERDLTARQLAIFLICHLEPEPQTVRSLAARLRVAKPAISRALDRLETTGLARRVPDPRDRRSVLVAHTSRGRAYMGDLAAIMLRATTPERLVRRKG